MIFFSLKLNSLGNIASLVIYDLMLRDKFHWISLKDVLCALRNEIELRKATLLRHI